MAKQGNTYKVKPRSKQRTNLFTLLENSLKTSGLVEENLSGKYLPYILFLMFLGILYIGNGHYAENSIRKVAALQRQVEDLRADYHTLKADYMFSSKQSEVAIKVKGMDLYESLNPPYKIEVKNEH
ncbi:MAG: FtsL-like putative cell division protein [Cyclobacteriaceae bacterium]